MTRTARHSVLLFLLATSLWAIAPRRELYVVNTKPSSVAVVDSENWKLLGTVPVDPNPSHIVIEPQNRFLYVLHNGLLNPSGLVFPKDPSKLTVLDVESRKVLKTIPLGWRTFRMSFLKDGRYLLCYSMGRPGDKKTKKEPGSITIIDTERNETTATLSTARQGGEIVFTSDASKIFVYSLGEAAQKRGAPLAVKPSLTVFSLDSEKPLAEMELDGGVAAMALSRDEKFLYLLNRGVPNKNPGKHRDGVVHVVDTGSLKIVKSHNVGTWPRGLNVDPKSEAALVMAQASAKDNNGKLFRLNGSEMAPAVDIGRDPQFVKRFGDEPGRFLLTYDELRFQPDTGALASSFVALNPKKGAPPPAPGVEKVGGFPSETLYLPGQGKIAFTVLNNLGAPTSKLAIVNLKDNKVERVVTTGRGSVKFGKFMGAMALSIGLSSLSYYANYSIAQSLNQPYFFYNVYVFTPAAPNVQLSSSADGKFVYALNTQTNDITMIDSADGKVLGHVPVGGGGRRVLLSPGGKFAAAQSNRQITLIDTATNKKHFEHQLTDGHINTLHVDEANRRLVALTSKSLLVMDTEQGKLLTTVDGFSEPQFLVEPRAEAASESRRP